MIKNYLKEMNESKYNIQNISDFHRICIPHLGNIFFSDRNAKILDVGSGLGQCLISLKNSGWQNLYAIDIDNFNKNFFKKQNIIFKKFNAETDKFLFENEFFDVVLSFTVIQFFYNPSNFMSEIYRVLKKEGIFILTTPDWQKQYKIFWRDPGHVHPYDKKGVTRLLRCYNFDPIFIKNFGVLKGFGKTNIWKLIKSLMFTGLDIICVTRKK